MTEPGSHRACAHCRAQKVRCIPDEKNPEQCQRCARVGRSCIFTPIQKRRQRKRTDTRVAELEREMRAMRAMLKNNPSGQRSTAPGAAASDQSYGNMWYDQIDAHGAEENNGEGIAQSSVIQSTRKAAPLSSSLDIHATNGDVVDRGVITLDQAGQFLTVYRTVLIKQYPMVPVAADVTVERMRVEKPVLFLAIMAAGSVMDTPELSRTLDTEVCRLYAERTFVKCEKSLEIIQAMLISAAWYAPPEKFTQLMYYKYINTAATMLLELGVATRPAIYKRTNPPSFQTRLHPAEDPKNPDMSMSARTVEVDPTSTEARRTCLAVFCLTTSSSFSLRRPNILRLSPYLRECLEHLETATDTLDSDRVIIAWIKLSIIISEAAENFHLADPQYTAKITDRSTQLMLKEYERRFMEWEAAVAPEDFVPGLKITYHFCRIVLHEVALHVDHSPEDFRAPYQMAGLHPSTAPDLPIKVLVDCIADIVSSAHAIMDTYQQLDMADARAMPVLTAVRISFAAFIIAKLCLSSMSRESRIAGLIDKATLKAEASIEKMILFARNVVGSKGRRVPAILMALLFKVRQWCRNPELIVQVEATPRDVDADVDEARTFDYAQTGLRATSASLNGIEPASDLQASEAMSNGTASGATSDHASMYGLMQMDLGDDIYSFWQDVNAYEGGLDWANLSNDAGNIMDTTMWPIG